MSYVIGLDFGTDSVRALLVDTQTGQELFSAVSEYPRWKKGLYCHALSQQFRQHPLDYCEAMEQVLKKVVKFLTPEKVFMVQGIGVDTTGSTPVPLDEKGRPLALLPQFAENPNAMFILWKDHTSVKEADEINALAHSGRFPDYTKYVGGVYSSEWFWAKMLHIYRQDPSVHRAAHSWVELCDWIPALLCGSPEPKDIVRGICAAGHKALYHADWDGIPPQEFWSALDPLLDGIRERLQSPIKGSEAEAGRLSKEWAQRCGLPEGIPVAVGAFDVHMGAVGAGIENYVFTRVMGTSTCDIVTTPRDKEVLVKGICGQVNGSVLQNNIGYEAGQSAYGDLFAWWKNLVAAPAVSLSQKNPSKFGNASSEEWQNEIFTLLMSEAENEPIGGLLATDWINGRRTPYANQHLAGWLGGITLGTTSAAIMRAWVEAVACGGRAIMENFEEQGVPIKRIVALGGVARKSPFVMQTSANIMNKPIDVVASDQCCALGAAIFGAIAAGIYPDAPSAMEKMSSKAEKTYLPQPDLVPKYQALYCDYKKFCALEEKWN